MIDLSALRAQLASAVSPIPVGGAADFAAITETGLARAPALWVVPLHDHASANVLDCGVHQRLTVVFSVLYAVRDVRDATGQAAADSLDAVRASVWTALINWTPPGGEPITYARGDLFDFKNSILYWQDQFQTQTTVRAV